MAMYRVARLAGVCLVIMLCNDSVTAHAQLIATQDVDFDLFGVAHPRKMAVLRFSRQGVVDKVQVRDGQHVDAGALLLSLDDRIARIAVELAKVEAEQMAALRTAKIELGRQQEKFGHAQQGFREDAVSEFELREKYSDLERAKAAVELEKERQRQGQAKLRMAEEEARALSLTAPFEGTVIQVHVDHGNTVGPSENAITIAQLDELEIEMHLPLKWFGKIELGQQYTVFAGTPVNQTIRIVAEFISPAVDSTSETVRAVFHFDNRTRKLPSGFEVRDLQPIKP